MKYKNTNREIKFKAWDQQEDKYLENVPYSHTINGAPDVPEYFDPQNPLGETLDGRIVYRQYTGIQDINGKEIYEGETVIAHLAPDDMEKLFVLWYDGSFILKNHIEYNEDDLEEEYMVLCDSNVKTLSLQVI